EIPPSGPALSLFRERLSAHAETAGVNSYFRVQMQGVRRFFVRLIQPLKFESYAPGAPRLIMRFATAFVVVSIVAVFVLMSGRFNSVSARELLDRSISAENAQIASASQPVVHQKIQVKRINADSEAIPETWEIWNDTENKRVQQASFNHDQTGRE